MRRLALVMSLKTSNHCFDLLKDMFKSKISHMSDSQAVIPAIMMKIAEN